MKSSHSSGLDILSRTKKIAIELKNRTNTDNASSRKTNFDKLANFKQNNPEYTCVYATINASSKKQTLKGSIKKIVHNGVTIEHHTGYACLHFILGKDTDAIIQFVKDMIDKYTP